MYMFWWRIKNRKVAHAADPIALGLGQRHTIFFSNQRDRGFSKYSLKDYYGAIADYTKFTELDPDNPVAFFLRGDAKDKIDDFKGRLIQLIQRKLQTGMDYFLPKFQM